MHLRSIYPVKIIIGILSLILFQNCGESDPESPPNLSLAALKAAPDTVTISHRRYVLQTYLWRDFMPSALEDGQPLIAIIKVIAVDSAAIPPDLDAPFVWVIYKDSIWAAAFSCEQRPQTQPCLEKIARNGPKWGPGVEVDVIVGLQIGSGTLILLRAPAQKITATT
jgi:hypothetical protein